MTHYLLAIDQGTTNSRTIIFNRASEIISQHELSLTQHFPQEGWVEQDPLEMLNHTILCCREALKKAGLSAENIAAIGISNQRETTIIWDKVTGKPIYPAIVWQDRRTSDICRAFEKKIGTYVQENTGLLLDPYFSASKIVWLLQHVPNAYERAERGELLFGTVDTFLLWHLTSGKVHATDATNASRTMLFNIRTQTWDETILRALDIPAMLLPTVLDNTAHFGDMDENILGKKIPIAGIAGDQQAATIGQTCFHPGMVKVTYGTGAFLLVNTGPKIIQSKHQLIATIAYRLNNKVVYGLEGSIFSAGVTVKWLRDNLHLIKTAAETEELARQAANTWGVYLVPAFTGLGAPYWQPNARAAILGLTGISKKEHIVRAALESVAYQTRDLLEAMKSDGQKALATLRVDGGMAANHWLLQFVSDMLDLEVQVPACIETSALGAAYLAGLQVGMYQSLDELSNLWQMNKSFKPQMQAEQRAALYADWQDAVASVIQAP